MTEEQIITESPTSVNVRGYYKGYSIQATVREQDAKMLPFLKKAVKMVDWMEDNGFKPSWNEATNKTSNPSTSWMNEESRPGEELKCEKCGQPAELKTGTSAAGRNWKGIFCSSGDRSHVKWIK